MKDVELRRRWAEAVWLLSKADGVFKERLRDIRNAQRGPAARGGDGIGGTRSVIWCDHHQREVERCHREDESCTGVPVVVSGDPTGEAAVGFDPVESDRAELDHAVREIRRLAEIVVGTMARYTPRQATDKERRETLRANEREQTCESCARAEVSRGVHRAEPARCRVVLPDGTAGELCRWCADFLRSQGALPSRSQLDAHHRGQKVRRAS